MNIGIRLHDTAPGTLEERLRGAKAQGFSCAHLALSKVVAGFRMADAPGRLADPDFAREVRGAFEGTGLECAVLGCYLNLADPAEESRLKTRDIYFAHLRFAKEIGAGVVGTETPANAASPFAEDAPRSEEAFHTAMHFANLLSVSEHLPVREKAGEALVGLFPLLRLEERNEIIVDLLRELETGQDEISVYIPRYLGVMIAKLPDKELSECLEFLEGHIRESSVRTATACLLTVVFREQIFRLYSQEAAMLPLGAMVLLFVAVLSFPNLTASITTPSRDPSCMMKLLSKFNIILSPLR